MTASSGSMLSARRASAAALRRSPESVGDRSSCRSRRSRRRSSSRASEEPRVRRGELCERACAVERRSGVHGEPLDERAVVRGERVLAGTGMHDEGREDLAVEDDGELLRSRGGDPQRSAACRPSRRTRRRAAPPRPSAPRPRRRARPSQRRLADRADRRASRRGAPPRSPHRRGRGRR